MSQKRFNWFVVICVLLLTATVAAGQKALTNEDVVKMIKAGLPEDTIVLAIQKSTNKFDTSPDALIALKEAGATQKVLETILRLQPSPTSNVGRALTQRDIDNAIRQESSASAGSVKSSMNLAGLKLGTYKAMGTETTAPSIFITPDHQIIRIKIESIDKDGNVKAELNRAGTKSSLTGKVDNAGKLQLKGLIVRYNEWEFTFKATVGDKALTNGKYFMRTSTTETEGIFDSAALEDNN